MLRFLSELEVDAALGHVVVRGDGVGERIGVNADRGCELLNRRALGDGRLLGFVHDGLQIIANDEVGVLASLDDALANEGTVLVFGGKAQPVFIDQDAFAGTVVDRVHGEADLGFRHALEIGADLLGHLDAAAVFVGVGDGPAGIGLVGKVVAHLFLVGRKAASRQDDRLVRLDVLGSSVVVGANADDSTVLIGDQAGGNGLVQNFGAGAFNSRLQGTEESHAGRLGLGHMTARSRRGHFLRFARELVARIAQADALFAIGEVGLKDFSREVDALLEAPVVNVLGLLGDKLQGVDVGGGAGHLHHVVEEVLGAVLDAVLLLQRGSAQVDETTVESGRAAANAGCLKDDDFGTGLARLDGGCRAGAFKTYHDDVGLFVPCHRIGSNARAGEIVFRARRGAGRKSAHGSYACSCKHRPFKK